MAERRTFTVTGRGVGRPDFSDEVYRADMRAGYRLQYGEQFKVFALLFSNIPSLANYVRGPLTPGEIVPLMDISTGIPMPYTLQQGYVLQSLQDTHNFTERVRADAYIDTVLATSAWADTLGVKYLQILRSWSTEAYDPTGALPHLIAFSVMNISAHNCLGFLEIQTILKAVGTPLFTDKKKVRCKWCGSEEDVAWETSMYTCPKCKKKTLFTIEKKGYPRVK